MKLFLNNISHARSCAASSLLFGLLATGDVTAAAEVDLSKLNQPPPQVTVQVRIVEVPEHTNAIRFDPTFGSRLTADGLGNLGTNLLLRTRADGSVAQENIVIPGSSNGPIAGILSHDQFDPVLQLLLQWPGVDLLTAPKVTTLSGQPSQIKIADVKPIITVANPSTTITQAVETGPTIDVSPEVLVDGFTIQLKVTGTVKEFVGYEAKSGLLATNGSLPVFRLRQSTATAKVPDQQTLVLSPGVIADEKTIKDKVPVLGDVPILGPLFRKESTEKIHKRLFFFITPTIIDPAGDPVHPPANAQPPEV